MRAHRQPASTWVLLADVRMSERRRQGLSARKVELYRQWLENGRHAPPVRLARDGQGFVVRDGRHRVAAAIDAGHVGIEAVLRRLLGTRLCWPERLACNEEERVRVPPSPSKTGLRRVNSSRAGAARLSIGRAVLGPCGSTPRIRPYTTTATNSIAAGRNGSGYR